MPTVRAPVPWLSVLITILTTACQLAEEARRYDMPGMTMPFKVRDEALLEGMAPGDLVSAQLMVAPTRPGWQPSRRLAPRRSKGRRL